MIDSEIKKGRSHRRWNDPSLGMVCSHGGARNPLIAGVSHDDGGDALPNLANQRTNTARTRPKNRAKSVHAYVHAVDRGGGLTSYYFQKHRNTQKAGPRTRLPDDPSSAEFRLELERLNSGFSEEETRPPPELRDFLAQRVGYCVQRAKRRKLACTITLKDCLNMYRQQYGRCAISGIRFHMNGTGDKFMRAFAPSIDRRDNAVGYVPENVRLVCRIANFAMGPWGEAALLELAKAMTRRNRR